jgi:hypothetical protein
MDRVYKGRQTTRLAVTTTTRSEVLPDVPVLGETLPGYEVSAWFGIGAPKNTPVEVIERLNTEVNVSIADAKFNARLALPPSLHVPIVHASHANRAFGVVVSRIITLVLTTLRRARA